MAAFRAAVELGYDYVETDVHATSDGIVVAFHDETLDRVGGTVGAIADLPWSTVRQVRVLGQHRVPSLEEVLTTWPDLRVNVDIKAPSAVRPFVDVVERLGAHDRVCVASFSDRRRRQVEGRLSRPVTSSAGIWVNAAFVLSCLVRSRHLAALATRGVDVLQIPERSGRVPVATARTIDMAHRLGLAVHVWTVNDADDMRRFLDLGVDGLITDRADVLRDVLIERGQWSEP